ncbi:hypothetical protein GGD65_006893 [Bradyrhizobium sp. CIR18]|uniref:hypothetical protein n=1 Tax=Bradyrhizobium sp. CIR18 TaxID=2663839 RepID=UPI001606C812|nr:hypothetical protein [Bradyrhizobium sp. CIR18]MBB4365824.1 hypothetical protein [Bradyrhizobium sp. CIR18]
MSATYDEDRMGSAAASAKCAVLLLCSTLILVPVDKAKAQCTAQDVLRNHLALKAAAPAATSPVTVSSAADIQLWKKVTIGTFTDLAALRSRMGAFGRSVGSLADEIIARPAFTLSGEKNEVDLVAISAAELGFEGEMAPLGNIYAHAQLLGLRLAPAEVAPQLRLQYLDRPIGEFLIIAMKPIRTWAGEPVILTVANGGAGLILIGQNGQDDLEAPVRSRFVFVRTGTFGPALPAGFGSISR